MLTVVLVHVGLIAGFSLLRRKNQALPMLTVLVDGKGPDLAKRNDVWLAAMMLLAVLAFFVLGVAAVAARADPRAGLRTVLA